MSILNQELFEKARSVRFQADESILKFIAERKNVQVEAIDTVDLHLFLQGFLKLASLKWKAAGCHIKKMEGKFSSWLNQEAEIPSLQPKKTPKKTPQKTPQETTSEQTPQKTPQKRKDFSELSKRSKNRATEELRASTESSQLIHATQASLKKDGKGDVAFLLSEAEKSPTRATKLRRLSGIASSLEKVPSAPLSLPQRVSNEDALAHLFFTNMTREAYTSTRLVSKEHGADVWPSYKSLQATMKPCRPSGIQYEEMAVVVPIQERLRHNDQRLMKIYDVNFRDLLQELADGDTLEVEGEAKIGFDGSTGNSMYNQAFSLENRDVSDESLLSTCLVPLQYKIKGGDVIFQNPKPQGVTFCQPLRLEYRKETASASKEIDSWIDEAIADLALTPNVIQVGTKFVKFQHRLLKTMMDVKAKNACTDTASSLRCFLCGASSKHFNDVENVLQQFKTDPSKLVYGGIADLHAWLRAFDAFNTLSDKLPVKKWSIRSAEDKAIVAARKEARKRSFKEKLGLIVDVPKGGGSGNSNTGNTARRAFQEEAIFAEITGVNQELIHRTHVMIAAINTNATLKEEDFKAYGRETATLWASLYGWCYMPVTLHQLYLHAWESIRLSALPLSFFSEQSLESCNKTFKHDREHHSRKDSRLHTIQDQFHRQTDRSDLLIGLKLVAKQKKKPQEPLPDDVLALLDIEKDDE